MKQNNLLITATGLCSLVFTVAAHADVRLPQIFGSHMVLQQEKPITIWGWADPGEDVRVEIRNAQAGTKANARGEWQVKLPAMKAGDPASVVVTGKNVLRLDDVLIGEVWLCSGQSNLEWCLALSTNGAAEIGSANFPSIRMFTVPQKWSASPQADVDASWWVCAPQAPGDHPLARFSAVAYHFGLELHRKLDVPVGLIQSAWGGTEIQPWTAPAGFAEVPEFRPLFEKAVLSDPSSPEHQTRLARFTKATTDWENAVRKTAGAGSIPPAKPIFPTELAKPKDQHHPCVLYNGMIRPLQPFGLRGIIWYQGESNVEDGMIYTERMRALVEGWRDGFEQKDLPFFYVQIAPFHYGNLASNIVPEFWEAQEAALRIPGTGMIVTTDIGDINDIHPRNKRDVGRRLALLALAQTYGISGLVHSGPVFKSFSVEGAKMRVNFNHTGEGLVSRDGNPLDHFELIDRDSGGFVPAVATIDGASVVLKADSVQNPAAVRFGWNKIAQPNLMNKEGLPARPFRAGTPPKRDSAESLRKTSNEREASIFQPGNGPADS
jgi:sialate O-acetylesterase